MHQNSDERHFFGPTAEDIFNRIFETIYVYRALQPFNTLKRLLVAVPAKAELEIGFTHWLIKLNSFAKAAGIPIAFYATRDTIAELQRISDTRVGSAAATYHEFENWEDFLIFTKELRINDFFVIVTSRKERISYNKDLDKLPGYLTNYFKQNSYMILYPKQLEPDLLPKAALEQDSAPEMKPRSRGGFFKTIREILANR
ncbi:MAG: hypothetical protein EOO38_21920 [Cytophagaceae bacterium]|nr:MAG: hypothetical protein EOO38_21920 [Cytophagaceae bacterium]